LRDRLNRLCEHGRDSKWFCCRHVAGVSVMAASLRPPAQASSLLASSHSLSLMRGDAEPIRNQAAEPAATAPPSAAMICMIQDALPTEVFGWTTSAFGRSIAAAAGAGAAGAAFAGSPGSVAAGAAGAAAALAAAKLYKGVLSGAGAVVSF